MSITLYTPATGFPDLEAKIAYGLARVGIEAGFDLSIIPQNGFYQVNYYGKVSSEKANQTFLMIAGRLLSSDRFFNLGVKAKDKSKYPTNQEALSRLSTLDISRLFESEQFSNLNIKRNKLCGHRELLKFGATNPSSRLGGLVLLASSHAGKPYFRDNRSDTFNLSLCEVCGYLAVLGLFSFCFNVQIGKGKNRKYINVVPVPEKVFEYKELQMLLALQKTLHNFWLSDLIPASIFTLSLLAKTPSLSDFLLEMPLSFHLSLVSKDNRGDTVIEQTSKISTLRYTEFINDSSYNPVVIDKLLGNFKELPNIAPLLELDSVLITRDRSSMMKFARLYVQETSTNNFTNLLYTETTKYLLREVAMINSEIIENTALWSLARTLRYFIRQKKYGYADNIRNARKESKDFEDTIAKMLREGELRRSQQEQDRKAGKRIDNWIHLPTDEEMKEVFRLANADFEQTKTALVILAFSFPVRVEEETTEITEEVQNA